MVQARITKSLPSAVWKTLVSGTVQLFHWCEIGPRLLLTTNRKSYTGSRLAPNLMTLNDLERQNRGFYGFLGDFEL